MSRARPVEFAARRPRSRPGDRRIGVALGLALIAALAGPACSPDSGADPSAGAPTPIALSSSVPPFLEEMEGVLDGTRFRGVRVHRAAHFVSNPSSASLLPTSGSLETREIVASDGAGAYAIELLDVLQLPPSIDPVSFPIAFERSVDSRWHLREFRIRDFDALLGNYTVVAPGVTTTVAGRTCERIELSRIVANDGRPGHYVLDVDPQTAFVLAMRELDEAGATIQEFEYETIDFSPGMGGVALREGEFDRTPLDVHAPLGIQAGFDVRVPDLLPEGFQLVSGTQFAVPQGFAPNGQPSLLPTGDWVRLEATDGVEAVRFAHSRGAALVNGAPSTVRIVEEGAWRIAFGEVHGIAIVCSGRIGQQSIRRLVESAF